MYIERIQVEEGFLDGLDVHLVPGLNVIIGARGTGKTSLIELIRFCTNAKGYSLETSKRSINHANSILGTGQVTLTLTDGTHRVTVARTASDPSPRHSGPFLEPIIFSQTEIESVGLQPEGRLGLLDSFAGDSRSYENDETLLISEIRSKIAELELIRRELESLNQDLSLLPAIEQQLAKITHDETQLTKLSDDTARKMAELGVISTSLSSKSVAHSSIERFTKAVSRWKISLLTLVNSRPSDEGWPPNAGDDLLREARVRLQAAVQMVEQAAHEFAEIEAETATLTRRLGDGKLSDEDQARHLRKDIELLNTGAGRIAREGQQLRERKAQLEALRQVKAIREAELTKLLKQRNGALEALDKLREARFKIRNDAAKRLNATLGPRIQITVGQAGQYGPYSAAIADAIRGSGLHYSELAPVLAQTVSPRELLEAVDSGDFSLLVEAAGLSKDRAMRVVSQLKSCDLGSIATAQVEDIVNLALLDGTDYKNISDLSTGQRCTVVLPLVLRHTGRLLIVDQPEDHIDNGFIADTLIQAVLARDADSQIIFSTHNANIPVLGNADRVIQLGSDGRRGFALVEAELDAPQSVHAITTIMEGGRQAFGRRASFYDRHKQQ